jgi:hypothetical protein
METTVRDMLSFVLLVVAATACETTSDPIDGIGGTGGGGVVTQAQAAGNWSISLRRTTTLACGGGSLADGQIITAHFDVLGDGTLGASTSTWLSPSSSVVRPLTGAVRLTDGVTNALFYAAAGNSSSAMELRGTITSSGTMNGTLTDPAAGFTPVFSVGGCEYVATGTRTG